MSVIEEPARHRRGRSILRPDFYFFTFVCCLIAVVVLIVYGARQMNNNPQGSPSPTAIVQLREGYGLSSTPRPGWVPIEFAGRNWYVTPMDIKLMDTKAKQ